MKVTVKKPVEIEISHVRISVPLHDDTVQEMGSAFPLLNGETWSGTIEIETGKIVEWPEGLTGHFVVGDKVRDGGTYILMAPDGSEVAAIREDYVPNRVVPGKYGDYIDLDIHDGVVTNWPKNPRVSEFFGEEDD